MHARSCLLRSLLRPIPSLLFCLGVLGGGLASAEDLPTRGSAILDLGAGYGGPFGSSWLDAGYATAGRLTFGLGIGFVGQEVNQVTRRPFGIFARTQLWRRGLFSVAVGTTLARGGHWSYENYGSPTVEPGWQKWSWNPGYRADLSVPVELLGAWWSLRIEPGLGYYLNAPECEWAAGNRYFRGDCDSAEIPAAYHPALTPGRFAPSIAFAAGLRLGPDLLTRPPRPAAPATDWTGTTWLAAIALGDLVGVAGALALGGGFWALTKGSCHTDSSGEGDPFCGVVETAVGATLGWTLGLTTGVYAVGRRSLRRDGKWGMTFLGMLAGSAIAALGVLAVYAVAPGDGQTRSRVTAYGGLALAATLPVGAAAMFYRASASPPSAPATLLSYSAERGLSSSVPIPFARTTGRETCVSAGLLGGSF